MISFEDILGYEKQVAELKAICDYLKNTQKYKDMGVKIPDGVLICGESGVGKTLFANVLAAESGRTILSPLDKNERGIGRTLKKALKNMPCVLVFDDLDYYPESLYPAIDDLLTELNGEDIFVISTVTEIEKLPESLLCCDAFDNRIVLNTPSFEDSKLIFKRFFSDKRVENNFNLEDFCYIAQDCSVSTVEDIYNDALIYAVHDGAKEVGMRHIFKAAMKWDEKSIASEFNESTAYHEAGHAVVSLLNGEEAAYVVLIEGGGGQYVEKNRLVKSYRDRQNDYLVAFAGNACEELFMGESAMGGYTDLGKVSQNIERDNKYLACQGFEYYDSTELNSPAFNDALAKKVQSDMQSYYNKAQKMCEENKPLVNALVEALKTNHYLLHSEIHNIYNKYLKSCKR